MLLWFRWLWLHSHYWRRGQKSSKSHSSCNHILPSFHLFSLLWYIHCTYDDDSLLSAGNIWNFTTGNFSYHIIYWLVVTYVCILTLLYFLLWIWTHGTFLIIIGLGSTHSSSFLSRRFSHCQMDCDHWSPIRTFYKVIIETLYSI